MPLDGYKRAINGHTTQEPPEDARSPRVHSLKRLPAMLVSAAAGHIRLAANWTLHGVARCPEDARGLAAWVHLKRTRGEGQPPPQRKARPLSDQRQQAKSPPLLFLGGSFAHFFRGIGAAGRASVGVRFGNV